MKGELEGAIRGLPFRSIYILQPSLLVGHRAEERLGEKLGYRVLNALNSFGLLKAYRPIEGRTVAQAMLKAAIVAAPGVHVHALGDVFALADGQ
jgi:hypothetical protein